VVVIVFFMLFYTVVMGFRLLVDLHSKFSSSLQRTVGLKRDMYGCICFSKLGCRCNEFVFRVGDQV
jgi:hypothetical protein